MNAYKKYKKSEDEPYGPGPCSEWGGAYKVVDVIYTDGSKSNEWSKDVRWSRVSSWRLAENQRGPKKKEPHYYAGGECIDYTAPSSAQEYGFEDNDFKYEYWHHNS